MYWNGSGWGGADDEPGGPHGGNMDIVEVGPGSTLYLPVFVPGALLYLGDAHAAMGHGELPASGLEMPAETEITVSLKKGGRYRGLGLRRSWFVCRRQRRWNGGLRRGMRGEDREEVLMSGTRIRQVEVIPIRAPRKEAVRSGLNVSDV